MSRLVGIDASRYTTAQRTGTENYSYHLINAISEIDDPGLVFRYYLNSSSSPGALAGKDTRPIPFPRFWTHARLSLEMAARRPDLLFVPAHVIPLVHPRSVVTVHDLGYLREPEAHPERQRLMLDWTTRWNTRVAAKIIAISSATRDDLVRHYGIEQEKIEIVAHGVDGRFQPQSLDAIAQVRNRLHLPEQFILAVGTIQPRKNLGNLARAIRILRDDGRAIALVTAGKHGWMASQVEAEIRTVLPKSAWRHLGFVPDDELPALYSAASCVAMVSRYEGFGLPVLEAMASGAPVLISDRGSLPEVAGGHALTADPDETADIAAQLRRVLDDPPIRDGLIARGMRRAATFTWERAAHETIDVLDDTVRPH
jgi:glycosyltransferase involved in cell wall biosynthesis